MGVASTEVIDWSEGTDASQTRVRGPVAMHLARMLLRAWQTPGLAEAAVRRPDDDLLGGSITFKLGALATLLMLVASTGFDIRLRGLVIHKDPLSPETLAGSARFVEAIRSEVPAIGGGGRRR